MKAVKNDKVLSRKHGLGLGLDQLLSDIENINNVGREKNSKLLLQQLSIDLLKPGKYQPRRDMNKEALDELANSIRVQGIIQPIIVRPIVDGNYEIITGERRWRAAKLAELHEIPVVVREVPDEQVAALSLIENIQREDLNAIDTAIGLQRLINEFNMTHEAAAAAIGKSRTTVTNLLRLLDLSEEIKRMVQQNKLEMGHARALLTLDSSKQLVAAEQIASRNLSVRATEILVRRLQEPQIAIRAIVDPNITQLQSKIVSKLMLSVNIYHTKKNKGRVVIKYNDLNELNHILKYIG